MTPTVVDNGQAALEALRDANQRGEPFRLLILDGMMPTMDGWEILQTLQTDPETQHIPVIVCSVWDEPELAFSLGAVDFLKKPITQKELLDALARLALKV